MCRVLHKLGDEPPRRLSVNSKRLPRHSSALQHRLERVEWRHVFPLPEQADRNRFAPAVRLVHCGTEIHWIVPRVFQLYGALLEKLMGVVFVEGDTRTEAINECETTMLHAAFDQVSQMPHLSR